MPRKDFISSFDKSQTDLEWIEKHVGAKRKHSSTLSKLKSDVLRAQRKLIAIEDKTPMKLKTRIQEDMKNAMRSGAQDELKVIRLILSAIKQIEVDSRISIEDDNQTRLDLEEVLKEFANYEDYNIY